MGLIAELNGEEGCETYHRVAVQEDGHASELLLGMLNGPFNILELLLPARLCVRTVLALVLFVQCGPPKAALVIGEDGDPAGRPSREDTFVARDMLRKTMDEHDRSVGGGRGTVCPGEEPSLLRAIEPGFREGTFSHDSSSGLGGSSGDKVPLSVLGGEWINLHNHLSSLHLAQQFHDHDATWKHHRTRSRAFHLGLPSPILNTMRLT